MLIYKGKAADYFYQQTGEGIPVIFAHGLFVDHTIFDTQVESLQESYTCYSFDLPAHGKSTFNPDGWTLEDIAEDFKKFIIDNDIKKPMLVGLSQGGMVFMLLAASHPELVGRLVLVGSSHLAEYPDRIPLWKERIEVFRNGDKRQIEAMIERVQQAIVGKHFLTNHTALREKELQVMKNNNFQAMIPATEAAVINRTDVSGKLENITCPTLIVVGTEDHATPIEIAEEMKSKIQNASLAIIPGVGHHAPIEAAQLFTNELTAFLNHNAL
ncbi:MAG: alpha/beta hydrolase [Dysgonomonas sp.]|nr:alpha/beta hydrolase [Dysgonomonas sp.]